jgi:hypothetical protein
MTNRLENVLASLDSGFDAATQRLCDLLRIPSISAKSGAPG